MKRALALPLAAAALLWAPAALASTPTATVDTATASFANVQPSTASAAYCPPAQPAKGCTALPAVQVRWGTPVDPANRSGLGFAPIAGATTLQLDHNFVLGTLTHFNWATYSGSGATSVDLQVRLDVQTPEGAVSFTLPFTLGIDETDNTGPPANCTYQPAASACPDAITLPLGATHTSVTTGGRTYTLTVLGFTASPTSTVPESLLVTQEQQDNVGYLVASLSRDNTAPTAADDTAATSSGGSTTIDVLGNDSDAENDPLTPSVATVPAHGTATVNADGTITYTASDSFAGTDTFTYTDSDGFASSQPATVTVTVTDTTPPQLSLPTTLTAEATGPDGAAVSWTATAADNVDGTDPVACSPTSGSTFPLGTTHVNCSTQDAAGNPASGGFDLVVQDTTPPTLGTMPADVTAEATGAGGAAVTYTAPTATDLVDPSPTVTCLPASGSTFGLGTTTVSCTASDHAGNTSPPSSFDVTVQDTTPPAITVPASFTVDATSTAGAVVTYPASAHDLVDPSPTLTCAPASGSTFAPGPTLVTCTATDASSNTSHTSFTVTVNDAKAQIDALLALVAGYPPGKSLPAKVRVLKADIAAGDTGGACSMLASFVSEVKAQRGKQLTTAQADDLLARAAHIGTALGC